MSADDETMAKATLADLVSETTVLERQRDRCGEVLEALSAEDRALSEELHRAEAERDALERELRSLEEEGTMWETEVQRTHAEHDAVAAELGVLTRRLSEMAERELAGARALRRLRRRAACTQREAALARDDLARLRYKLQTPSPREGDKTS